MKLTSLLPFAPRGLAIDLGTANTLVYVRGQGVILEEPSVVAMEVENGVSRVLAVGTDAKLMMGKTPANVKTVRPLRSGVIADFDVAEQMLKHFIAKAHGKGWRLPSALEIVICVPSSSTSVERRAIRDAASNAGASSVWLIAEPMAAAIGANMPVLDPVGSMVVDIGGGTTEVGVIALHGLSYAASERIGGDRMDEAIVGYIRRNHGLLIGEGTAERVKLEIGCARLKPEGETRTVLVRGRDVAQGMPSEVELTQSEIVYALAEPVARIVHVVRSALEHTQPEIAADIIDEGITMTGGGSLLPELGAVIAEETGLPVRLANDPLRCVVLGAGRALEDPAYRAVLGQS